MRPVSGAVAGGWARTPRSTLRATTVLAALVAAAAVAGSVPAGAAVTEAELRSSVTPLMPQVRAFRPGPAVVPLVRRQGRHRGGVGADVLFDFGRAAVRPAGRTVVMRLARAVTGRTGTLHVVGHTDGLGSASRNRRLSLRRARAVAAIVGPALPAEVRVVASGRGDTDPVADETTADGRDDPDARARNRRVQLRFTTTRR